ncbi:hypothetical protein M5K25_019049 [Dendrobium thyrsiflorum]|uniref:Uncharacterized protein n=1 Tax=Dendrobium thyrsiflorum TaxID=117978 RepID=A0ABD0UDX9_DENTH
MESTHHILTLNVVPPQLPKYWISKSFKSSHLLTISATIRITPQAIFYEKPIDPPSRTGYCVLTVNPFYSLVRVQRTLKSLLKCRKEKKGVAMAHRWRAIKLQSSHLRCNHWFPASASSSLLLVFAAFLFGCLKSWG